MSSLECKGGGLSVFTKGDLIAAYPKEGAVLFVGVVVLSVVLENLLGAFRENRSRYVMRLYVQVNEEVMILGIIGLMFVFVEQSLVSYLPAHWVLLLQWVQAVLFCLAVFVIFGVVYTAAVTHAIVPWLGAKVTSAGPDLSQVIQHEQLLLAERQRQREAQRADRRIAIDEARAAHAAVAIGDRSGSAAEPRRVSDANQNGNGQGRRSSSTMSGAYPSPPHRRKSSSSFAAATQAQAWRDATLKIDADADDAADAHEDLLRSAAIGGGRLAKQSGPSNDGQQTANRGPARGLSIFGETVRSVVSGNGRTGDDSFANAGNAGPARQTTDYDEEYTARLTAEATRRPTLAAGGPLTRIRLALAFAYGNHLLTQQSNNQAAATTSATGQRNGGQNVGTHGSHSGNRNGVGRSVARPHGGRNILADPRQAADDAIADAAPLQQYLLARHRDTVVSFADVTWQCWLSVVFLAGLNGFRLYFLPANRDGRDPAMYTDDDRLQNTLTFVFLVGWLPAVAYLIAVSLMFRHFWRYVRSVERSERQHRFAAKLASSTQHRSRMATAHTAAFGGYMDPHSAPNLNTLRGAETSGHRIHENGGGGYPNDAMDLDEGDGGQESHASHASPRGGDGGRSGGAAGGHGSGIGVWLPPRHIVEHMTTSIGSMDDPSLYLLRGHKGFTVHMLKIPLLLIQLYLSFFVAGQWGVVAQTFGPSPGLHHFPRAASCHFFVGDAAARAVYRVDPDCVRHEVLTERCPEGPAVRPS